MVTAFRWQCMSSWYPVVFLVENLARVEGVCSNIRIKSEDSIVALVMTCLLVHVALVRSKSVTYHAVSCLVMVSA